LTKVEFEMVKGDLLPAIVATLKDTDGAVIALTGASVKFHMKKGATILVDSACTINSALGGIVQYDWVAGDTDVTIDLDGKAVCEGEFEVTFAGGKIQTFPTKPEFFVIFREEVA